MNGLGGNPQMFLQMLMQNPQIMQAIQAQMQQQGPRPSAMTQMMQQRMGGPQGGYSPTQAAKSNPTLQSGMDQNRFMQMLNQRMGR